MKIVNVAVAGVTGLVGGTFIKVMEERGFSVGDFYAFASEKSVGQKIIFNGKEYSVLALKPDSFDNSKIDIALFSMNGALSLEYAPVAARAGCVVIDNSSAWRMEPGVPLVVPEVNPEDIMNHKGIIANPNCSTIQAVVSLKPLHTRYRIKRVVYSTYQSVSGAGIGGRVDLEEGLAGRPPRKFRYKIAHNVIPQIDLFTEGGYTKEELKMINETRKILHCDNMRITATCVRVPVFYGHSESINVEFEEPFKMDELIDVLASAPGIVLKDDVENDIYPMPIESEGRDEVFVGRIRRDDSVENGINMWVVADNIRKGAATNAVQIAEKLVKEYF